MDFDASSQFRRLIQEINSAEKILLITHKKPDGDALGSITALKLVLDYIQKPNQMACVDEAPVNLLFIPAVASISKDFTPSLFNLFITLDCGADYMTGYLEKYPQIFSKNTNRIINIDHHPSNNNFGFLNIVIPSSASTSMILYDFLQFARFAIDPLIATSLLTGIYTDTGSFMHSNTNEKVYNTAAKLLKLGAKLNLIVKHAFKTTPISTLKLWGRVLSTLRVNSEGITMAAATQKDFDETGSDPEQLSGVIDLLNAIPNSKFSVLLNEDGRGQVKGSFRTQNDDINLSKIASVFGGGGHKKAAGFTLTGHLEREVRWKIVN